MKPKRKKAIRILASCRWCDRSGIRLQDMAICSYVPWVAGITGVCNECVNGPEAEERQRLRLAKVRGSGIAT
jgi:hypothetical protein